ncbi:hypothetical protein UA74_20070 [Actinoalloteichus fjordicus]|uniref:Uncharacterized protein n=2 Tax=Actinoalloteichus fjordicus TaxID=1612552 RepID=A0AAC9PSX4_9PSEU|nr:hypothetical protein UA74_20070 [Actinoalloteichus fjordicus]
MNCSVSFTSEDFDSTEVPIGRHAGFDYNIVTEEQGTGDPEEEATDRYLRTLDRAPNSATLLPIPGLGDEAHYWHQEEVPTGAHVSFRQHNLTVKVTVWGNDRNSTGEEVPMPQQEAEEAARHLAEAVFDNL